jgi:phytoene dehydrogenase-like protein
VPPTDPTIYLAITSKSDEQHAPVSSENWFLLINMPYINKNLNEERIELMMNVVLNKLKNFGFDISNNIEFVHTITPFDLESSYSSNKGSIYGISSNSRFTAFKRHPNRSRILKNLFFAGGSVHPGGGVPLVLSSGKLVSDLILNHDNF